ncbi:MAG: hypothetical protein HQK84_05945 [Nitrospinae bacterium]|nr:hypothetical protein [Nitrospinota bacterium]
MLSERLLLSDVFRGVENRYKIRLLYNETDKITAEQAQIAEGSIHKGVFIITAAVLFSKDK